MNGETSLWKKQAEEDLKTAETNLKQKIYYAAAFFAHQSAEKILKAVCIKKFKELIKVHDLVFLARKADATGEIVNGCRFLNKAYIEARYPSDIRTPSDVFSKEDAEKCISIAKGVYQWAEAKL